MGKFGDIWKKRKDGTRSERKCFLIYICFTLLVFILWCGIFGRNSIVRWIRSQWELSSLNQEISDTRRAIDDINVEIRNLSEDRDSLEKYARETYGFSEPGDSIYLVK